MTATLLAQAHSFEKVCKILEQHAFDPSKLIPILQATQEQYRYLPEEVLHYIATSLNLAPARVFGVATFYSHFALAPKGKYVVRVCDGTACHVKKSEGILASLRKTLGLTETQQTTPDMLFTLETVSCLGACGIAPVLVVNEVVHGAMTPEKTTALIQTIRAKEASHEN